MKEICKKYAIVRYIESIDKKRSYLYYHRDSWKKTSFYWELPLEDVKLIAKKEFADTILEITEYLTNILTLVED